MLSNKCIYYIKKSQKKNHKHTRKTLPSFLDSRLQTELNWILSVFVRYLWFDLSLWCPRRLKHTILPSLFNNTYIV